MCSCLCRERISWRERRVTWNAWVGIVQDGQNRGPRSLAAAFPNFCLSTIIKWKLLHEVYRGLRAKKENRQVRRTTHHNGAVEMNDIPGMVGAFFPCSGVSRPFFKSSSSSSSHFRHLFSSRKLNVCRSLRPTRPP